MTSLANADSDAILSVELDERSYPIHIVQGGLDGLGNALAMGMEGGPLVVISDTTVEDLYGDIAASSLVSAGFAPRMYSFAAGEAHKTVDTWHELTNRVLADGVTRSTPVLALGGGVVGDIAGLVAATTLRGLPFIQVPTTLLAMVDSAVGGKVGVNTPLGKNLVGAFHQPIFVYAALETLRTLEDAEMRSGLGEVVKHGAIGDDALFALCEQQIVAIRARDPKVLRWLVEKSCRVKSHVVSKDERENGIRAILNFGHSVGHAIETCVGHGTLRHGECVAIGMVAEAEWACRRGACDEGAPHRIRSLVEALGLGMDLPQLDMGRLSEVATRDKKVGRGKLKTAELTSVGTVRLVEVEAQEIDAMLAQIPGLLED